MMLAAGKRVLCEKPMSLTAAGAKKVLDFAHQQQLLYIEVSDSAFLFRYLYSCDVSVFSFSALMLWLVTGRASSPLQNSLG